MIVYNFLNLAEDLELAGLVWQPEIGDEIADRDSRKLVSVLVDSQGMTPRQLRSIYIWLPTVEQMVTQFEARHAILCHAGLELSDTALQYKTVIKADRGLIEVMAPSLRQSVGFALRDLLLHSGQDNFH